MTGIFPLDWALFAVSLLNTTVLLWLGLTVLLSAARRTWVAWMVSGGLLFGCAFFAGHTALLGYSLRIAREDIAFRWYTGWVCLILLPCAWYLVMLWFSGQWEGRGVPSGRHRFWLPAALVAACGMLGWLVSGDRLGPYLRLILSGDLDGAAPPPLPLVYPVYILLCNGLALDALRLAPPPGAPAGVEAARGEARLRARPWLAGTTVLLILASVIVAWAMVWLALSFANLPPGRTHAVSGGVLGLFDLAASTAIALANLSLGQAIVSYEAFSGRDRPRRGLQHQWRSALLLSLGYGVAVGWALAAEAPPIYALLLATLLVFAFHSHAGWRGYSERERSLRSLRPLLSSSRLYEGILNPPAAAPGQAAAQASLGKLCDELLGARVAYLLPLGSMAPLLSPGLSHPEGRPVPPPGEAAGPLRERGVECVPLHPEKHGGAVWAVALRSAGELVGALLLGEKRDGSLYAQEEIELARAAGERLLDLAAGAEMARRLMALQRRRLAETHVLDRRARRALHDDVLPRLHAALLTLSGTEPAEGSFHEALSLLSDVHRHISQLLREMPASGLPELEGRGVLDALRQVVAEELSSAFDAVEWKVPPEAERGARDLPPVTAEVLFHAAREAARNAARHGRGREPSRPLRLRVTAAAEGALELRIQDDGVGLGALEASRGAGQGLALHSTMMAVVGGVLSLESPEGRGTTVTLTLPQAAPPDGR